MARNQQYSDEKLLDDVRRVAELCSREPPRKKDYTEHGEHAPRTVRLRFGGWNEAMKEAGFEPRSAIEETRDRPSTCPLCEEVDEGLDFHHWKYGENEMGCYLCRECHDLVHEGDGKAKQPGWLPAAIENLVTHHLENHDEREVDKIIEKYNLPDVNDLVRREL